MNEENKVNRIDKLEKILKRAFALLIESYIFIIAYVIFISYLQPDSNDIADIVIFVLNSVFIILFTFFESNLYFLLRTSIIKKIISITIVKNNEEKVNPLNFFGRNLIKNFSLLIILFTIFFLGNFDVLKSHYLIFITGIILIISNIILIIKKGSTLHDIIAKTKIHYQITSELYTFRNNRVIFIFFLGLLILSSIPNPLINYQNEEGLMLSPNLFLISIPAMFITSLILIKNRKNFFVLLVAIVCAFFIYQYLIALIYFHDDFIVVNNFGKFYEQIKQLKNYPEGNSNGLYISYKINEINGISVYRVRGSYDGTRLEILTTKKIHQQEKGKFIDWISTGYEDNFLSYPKSILPLKIFPFTENYYFIPEDEYDSKAKILRIRNDGLFEKVSYFWLLLPIISSFLPLICFYMIKSSQKKKIITVMIIIIWSILFTPWESWIEFKSDYKTNYKY